jgi:hypothetical protein
MAFIYRNSNSPWQNCKGTLVTITEQCMNEDRCWTVKELIEHTQINGSIMLQILTGLHNIHHPKS